MGSVGSRGQGIVSRIKETIRDGGVFRVSGINGVLPSGQEKGSNLGGKGTVSVVLVRFVSHGGGLKGIGTEEW